MYLRSYETVPWEFCILNLKISRVIYPWIFEPNLPKKFFSRLKQKKWTPPVNSAYSNKSRYQISVVTDSFNFLDQICTKRVFLDKNTKTGHHHRILHIRISLTTKFQLKLTIFSYDQIYRKRPYPYLAMLIFAFYIVIANSTVAF